MCGRTFISESKDLARKAGLEEGGKQQEKDTNRPPGTEMPVILDARPGKLHYVKWGLIPSAATEAPKFNTAYARIETMHTLPSYKDLLGKKHCVFVVEGYYEWERGTKPKQPYYIQRKDQQLIYLAGLWDTWKDPRLNVVLPSATMIMQPANETMLQIHDRMPCLLEQQQVDIWLNRDLPLAERLNVLRPPSNDLLELWPVSKKVNNAQHKDNDNMKEIEPDKGLFD